jgi:hypothetical protein
VSRGLVRRLVRMVRRVPARSACQARARHPAHAKRAVRTAGCEASIQPGKVPRCGIRPLSSSEPEAGTVAVRLGPAVVRGWPAAQVSRGCGPDDPDQQFILWGTNRTYVGDLLVLPAQRLMPSATGVVHLVA